MTPEAENPHLKTILESWERRAQVRQHSLLPASSFDLSRKDFLPEWLPFFGHPTFERQRDREAQILSVAWLQYNQVTIEIENEIVIPLCLALQLDLGREEPYRTLVVQAMVDEAYHVLLTNHATEMTRKFRQLEAIRLPKGHFVSAMQKRHADCTSDWERNLVLLATGV
ncbi:MAG TPA: diiron oxygenase, partial [Myxococcota bacterium]|nr:diiron oxygenase [Myxococcota bacterium]